MKLNWAERWVVNNPFRALQQRMEIYWMKRRVGRLQGGIVLEVGCGRGVGAKFIMRAFRVSTLHASDLDINMIRKSKRNLAAMDRDGIFLHVADAFRLPYRNATLEAVFGFGVLHHVPDWRGAIAEISRVLKAGGYYFFEEIYPSVYRNWITSRILLHPREDRFESHDLKQALVELELPIGDILEIPRVGLLGISVREGGSFLFNGESQCGTEPARHRHQWNERQDDK